MVKVSVVIPLYNAEKYLGVCLESLLIQTLKDFEVIVVDDCSTDASPSVAENYLEKFGGRLKIITLPQNTGAAAVPRNVGLEFSQGKYVFFMDADDLLVDTALEMFYEFAETFQAEVVYTENGFTCGEETVPQEIVDVDWCPSEFVSGEPIFEPENILERFEKFSMRGLAWTPWTKFVRRDILIDNKIKFPQMRTSDDFVWTVKLLCAAKKILRIPTPLYIYRSVENSITRKNRSAEDNLIFWSGSFIDGLNHLCEFMTEFKFFAENPETRLLMLNLFSNVHLGQMAASFRNLRPHEVCEIFLREFSRLENIRPDVSAWLLLLVSNYRNELLK